MQSRPIALTMGILTKSSRQHTPMKTARQTALLCSIRNHHCFLSGPVYFWVHIRFQLEKRGQIIGPLDMLIAAHAISQELILITNNDKEFKRITKLKIENWTK